MGFSVRSETSGLEYSGESMLGLFGHFRNLTSPKHWGMVIDILKFHKLAENLLIQKKRLIILSIVQDLEKIQRSISSTSRLSSVVLFIGKIWKFSDGIRY